jgi:hypothetical protein
MDGMIVNNQAHTPPSCPVGSGLGIRCHKKKEVVLKLSEKALI